MSRPTRVHIDATALLHNLAQVKQHAPHSQIIAMVKANAYGCGIASVVPVLEGKVAAFGVACLEEAIAIRALGAQTDCILFQGLFKETEIPALQRYNLQMVIHQQQQLQWLLANPLSMPVQIWVKVNTGMHRLGFSEPELYPVLAALAACPWVKKPLGIMTHFASADEPHNPANEQQLKRFCDLVCPDVPLLYSAANSAAVLSLSASHFDFVRPGIMLYGISPFNHLTGMELGLQPVMRFISALTAINHYPAAAKIGYGGSWQTTKPSRIGIIPVGYGDGYPRHIALHTPVWIKGYQVPIVGRISMDMMTVDLTDYPHLQLGDTVELWGANIPVESIASSAGTIAYELICQISSRVRSDPAGNMDN